MARRGARAWRRLTPRRADGRWSARPSWPTTRATAARWARLRSEAVDLCRRSGDAVGLGLALHRLAVVPEPNTERREALLLEALALFEAADFSWGIGSALEHAGEPCRDASGDFARAEALYARSLAVHRVAWATTAATAAVLY